MKAVPSPGEWWWAYVAGKPEPVWLVRPAPAVPGKWEVDAAGVSTLVVAAPLEPVVPYIPWTTRPRLPHDVAWTPVSGDVVDDVLFSVAVDRVEGGRVHVTETWPDGRTVRGSVPLYAWRRKASGLFATPRPLPGSVVACRVTDPRAPFVGDVAP